MELESTSNSIITRSIIRKFTKHPQETKDIRKSKEFTKVIEDPLSKIYSTKYKDVKSLILSKHSPNPKTSNEMNKKLEFTIKSPQKLPAINSKLTSNTKRRDSISDKEEQLSKLISSYVVRKNSINLKTPKLKSRFSFGKDQQKQTENAIFEKNIESYRGKELIAYENDIEKNLRIEKIREKNFKRYKRRLQSS